MIPESQNVLMVLDSQPQSPTVVRSVLVGLAAASAVDPGLLDDLRTAVSEACNNVVLHAYPNGSGPLMVSVRASQHSVEAVICDEGTGIRALSASEHDGNGVGLAVMAALADRAEFLERPEGGTAVRLGFRRDSPGEDELAGEETACFAHPPEPGGEVVVEMSPPSLVGDVLGRAARALAMIAHFSVDRFADLSALADVISDHAQAAAGPVMTCTISTAPKKLELRIGPFRPGSLSAAVADGELDELGRLAHELVVVQAPDSESLVLSVIDRVPHRGSCSSAFR
ncbi:MAG: ATP-binding protein [Solirubrobacteraceae bacterium]